MYVPPTITDLGSFQELTLSDPSTGSIMATVSSLLDTAGGIVKGVVNSVPGTVDDGNGTHVSPGQVTVDHKIVVKAR